MSLHGVLILRRLYRLYTIEGIYTELGYVPHIVRISRK
jgi:hypothetical protein